MSKWDHSEVRVARARILVEFTDEFGDDVLAAMQYTHEQQGW